MKEAIHRKVYTVWFHVYGTQEQTKLIYSDKGQNSGYLWGILSRRECEGFGEDVGEMFLQILELTICINVMLQQKDFLRQNKSIYLYCLYA